MTPAHTKGVVLRLSTRVRCALYFTYLTNRIRSNEITYTYTQSDCVHHFSFFYLLTVRKCAPLCRLMKRRTLDLSNRPLALAAMLGPTGRAEASHTAFGSVARPIDPQVVAADALDCAFPLTMNDLLDGGQGGDRRRTARMHAACEPHPALPQESAPSPTPPHRRCTRDPTRPVEDGRKAAASGGGICDSVSPSHEPTLCQPSRKILPVSVP